MGSAPSKSTVQVIKQQQPIIDTPECAQEQDKDNTTSALHEDLLARIVKAEERAKEAESKASETAKEVESLSTERDDLLNQLKCLQKHANNMESSLAQEQIIKKLQDDVTKLQSEMVAMQQKHEHKLKKIRLSSAESKTESALAVFALKDQNAKLSEENVKLLERVKKLQDENDNLSRHTSASSCRRGPDSNDDDDDDESESVKEQHMQLILDLSEKVSSLDEELSQAKQLISQLQAERL